MLETLMSPGEMTGDQWMIVGILVLVFFGILFFIYRTWRVIQDSAQNKYKPNIGLSRIKEERAKKPSGSPSDIAARQAEKQDD